MKANSVKLILFLLILIGCNSSYKNKVVIKNRSLTNDSIKIIYAGIPNLVEFLSEDTAGISFSTSLYKDNKLEGKEAPFSAYHATEEKENTVRNKKSFYHFYFSYSVIGKYDTITFKKNGKVFQREIYPIKLIPDPTPRFALTADTIVSKQKIMANPCLDIYLPDCYFRLKFRVGSYDAYLYRNNKLEGSVSQIGPCLADTDFISKLEKGDEILFKHIHCIAPDNDIWTLAPYQIRIK